MVTPPLLPPGLNVSLSKVKLDSKFKEKEVGVMEIEEGSDNKLSRRKKKQKNIKKNEAKKAKRKRGLQIAESNLQAATSAEVATLVDEQNAEFHLLTTETTSFTASKDKQEPYAIVTFGSNSFDLYPPPNMKLVSGNEAQQSNHHTNGKVKDNPDGFGWQSYDREEDEDEDDDDDDDDDAIRGTPQVRLPFEVVTQASHDVQQMPPRPTLNAAQTNLESIEDDVQLTTSNKNRSHPRSSTISTCSAILDDATSRSDLLASFRRFRKSFCDNDCSRDYSKGWDCFRSTMSDGQNDVAVIEELSAIGRANHFDMLVLEGPLDEERDCGEEEEDKDRIEQIVQTNEDENDKKDNKEDDEMIDWSDFIKAEDADHLEGERSCAIASCLSETIVAMIDLVHEPKVRFLQDLKELWHGGQRYFKVKRNKQILYGELLNEECHYRYIPECEHRRVMKQMARRAVFNIGFRVNTVNDEYDNLFILDLNVNEEEVMREASQLQWIKAKVGIPTLIRDRRMFCPNPSSRDYPFAQIVDTQGNLNPITIRDAEKFRLIQRSTIEDSFDEHQIHLLDTSEYIDTGLEEGSVVDLVPSNQDDEQNDGENYRVLLATQDDNLVGQEKEVEVNARPGPSRLKRQNGGNAARWAAKQREKYSGKLRRPAKVIAQPESECKTLYSNSTNICGRSDSIASSTDSGLFLNDV